MGAIHNAKELPDPAQEPLLKANTGTSSPEEKLSSLTSVAQWLPKPSTAIAALNSHSFWLPDIVF